MKNTSYKQPSLPLDYIPDMDFYLGKQGLIDIGSLHEIQNDCYGTYYVRCVCWINWYPDSDKTAYSTIKIIDKYHPKHWGCSYGMQVANNKYRHNKYCSVTVPLLEDNLDWWSNNLHNQNASFVKWKLEQAYPKKPRKVTLPIGISVKQLKNKLIGLEDMIDCSYIGLSKE